MSTIDKTKGFLNDGFDFKGIHFAPITAGSMLIMERVKSPFLGNEVGLKGLLDYLYVHGEDRDMVRALSKSIDKFNDAVELFAEQFTVNDIGELSKFIEEQNSLVTDSQVEIQKDPASPNA